MTIKVKLHLDTVDYDVATLLMDDEIRDAIHDDLAPCNIQVFMDEYVKRHFAKYGIDFEVN